MLTVAHLSDCHLGFRRRGWPFVRADVHQRFAECLRAVDGQADVVVITGDLFDSPRLDMEALQVAARSIRAMSTPVLVVGGNHDVSAISHTESALHLLGDLCPNATVVTAEYRMVRLCGVEFHCVPARYIHRWTEPVHPTGDAVLLMHGVHPYSPMRPPSDAWLIPLLYDVRSFLYVGLGDLHDWHFLPTTYPPREFYAGSTSVCSTNPWGESLRKGWLKVVLGPRPTVTFMPVAQRAWLTIRVDLDDLSIQPQRYIEEQLELQMSVARAAAAVRQDPPAVRVVLQSRWAHLLSEYEQHIRSLRLPAAAVAVTRRLANMKEQEHMSLDEPTPKNLPVWWHRYVRENARYLPAGVSEEEVIRMGLERMQAAGCDPLVEALKVLVQMDDDYDDPDDPFSPSFAANSR